MTRKTRRLLLYLAVAFFLLAVPLILLYATGYSLDLADKKIVKTGGFYFKSTPSKAEIFIDDKLKGKTSRFIKRLLPRQYQIKIQKTGYHSWQKKLKIESHLVTEARNIFLVPQNPNLEIIASDLPPDFSLASYLDQEETIVDHFLINNQEEEAGYEIVDQEIYFIQKPSYILYKSTLDGKTKEQISFSPLPTESIYQVFPSLRRPAVLSDKNDLYLLNEENKTFELLAQNIKQVQFAHDNKKLLFSSDNEIWVYFLEDILIQPNKNKDEKELITRLSQPINEVLWYSATNEHIIFSVNDHIKIAELDSRDQRNIVDFLKARPDQMIYDHDSKKLYFVEKNKLYLTALEVP